MRKKLTGVLVGALLINGVSSATEPLPEPLKACVSMRRDAERLACFDKAIAMMEAGQVNTPAPSPENMFGANADVSEASHAHSDVKRDELKQISGTVTSQRRGDDGMIVLELDNGQVWRQQDNDATLTIATGDSVTINRASLGTFRITDKRGRSARFKRVR